VETADVDATAATAGNGRPRRCLSTLDAIAMTVGIVIGTFIFIAPSMVAARTSGPGEFLALWVLGGVISLIGALCYAELSAAYPDCGGDYYFLHRAYGGRLAFFYAWARLTVIQTGSIALLGFAIGEYATQAFGLGAYSTAIYAAVVIAFITGLNVTGLREGKWTQIILTVCEVAGVLLLIIAGFWIAMRDGSAGGSDSAAPAAPAAAAAAGRDIGLAMVFVLLTYGGWNEAAYLSAEVRERNGIAKALFWSLAIVTVIYVLANVSLMLGLGLPAMAKSETVAADLLSKAFGPAGAIAITVMFIVATASTMNATIFTGARTNYALGRDVPLFDRIGQWDAARNTPRNGLLLQGGIALALVVFGGLTNGLKTMVDYVTPVFWLFFLLVGVSLFVLRRREPDAPRPFRVPLYPLIPGLFCLACAYMLWSSVSYLFEPWVKAGIGTVVGLGVLALGLPLLLIAKPARRHEQQRGFDPVMAERIVDVSRLN
jgi:basic amino acid/polyamine antiporter, APA family